MLMRGRRKTTVIEACTFGLMVSLLAMPSLGQLISMPGPDGVIKIVEAGALPDVSRREPVVSTRERRGDGALLGMDAGPSELVSLVGRTAQVHGISPSLVMAIVKVESDFDPYALSPKGARGLMQLMPATARLYGLTNYYDPAGNLDAGVRHFKMLLRRYRDDLDLALAAYNAGCGAVERYGGIPPYEETIKFVRMVKEVYRRYTFGLAQNGTSGACLEAGRLRRFVKGDGTIVIRAHSAGQ